MVAEDGIVQDLRESESGQLRGRLVDGGATSQLFNLRACGGVEELMKSWREVVKS
jgi:hypothetical protein